MSKHCRLLINTLFGLLVFLTFPLGAAQFPAVPNPFHYVNDYTRTLSPQQTQYLEQKLVQYSQQTSSQIAVVMLPSVGEYAISDYAFSLGDKWGIGRKQLDNGVLMLIAKDDRKIFIAVGQGLEGVLPDALLSQLIRSEITPYFKKNQYAQGINQGLDRLIAASQGEYQPVSDSESSGKKWLPLLIFIAFALIVIFSEWRGRNQIYLNSSTAAYILNQASSHRRNSRDGFGNFGGGNSGGFGGGSFGGGGAGGSW